MRAAAVREDLLLETGPVRGPNLCEEMAMTPIHNLVRAFELLGTLPNTPEINNSRAELVSVILTQDVRTPEVRTITILDLYLNNPKPEYGLVIFEVLFTTYHTSSGRIVEALEKKMLDSLFPSEKSTLYPVLATSLMATSNWCDKSSEVSNREFSKELPRVIGRLLGRYAMMVGKLPSYDSTFMGRYSTALATYLNKASYGSTAFERASALINELDVQTDEAGVNAGVYQFLQELIQRVSMLFAQRTQIKMLEQALKTSHITTSN